MTSIKDANFILRDEHWLYISKIGRLFPNNVLTTRPDDRTCLLNAYLRTELIFDREKIRKTRSVVDRCVRDGYSKQKDR